MLHMSIHTNDRNSGSVLSSGAVFLIEKISGKGRRIARSSQFGLFAPQENKTGGPVRSPGFVSISDRRSRPAKLCRTTGSAGPVSDSVLPCYIPSLIIFQLISICSPSCPSRSPSKDSVIRNTICITNTNINTSYIIQF